MDVEAEAMFCDQGERVMLVPDEVSQLVRTSGNSFHAKVARWLRAHGWHIVVSPYYIGSNARQSA